MISYNFNLHFPNFLLGFKKTDVVNNNKEILLRFNPLWTELFSVGGKNYFFELVVMKFFADHF